MQKAGGLMSKGLLMFVRANPALGISHLMRSLDLAKQWTSRGGRVYYVVGQLPSLLMRKIAMAGCEIIRVEQPIAQHDVGRVLMEYAADCNCEWVALDDTIEEVIQNVAANCNSGHRLLVLGKVNPDLCKDIDIVADDEPAFALMRTSRNIIEPGIRRRRKMRRCLLDLGGLDCERGAELVRHLCRRFADSNYCFEIVTAFASSAANQLHDQNHPIAERVIWHRNQDRAFASLSQFDLTVATDSAVFFENAFGGVASLLLSKKSESKLAQLGNVTSQLWFLDIEPDDWAQEVCRMISKMLGSRTILARHAEEMTRLVDDRGSARLCQAMFNLGNSKASQSRSA